MRRVRAVLSRAAAPILCLVLGGIVYLSRPHRVIALDWVPDSFLGGARRGIHAILPGWLEGVLPDVLWSFALAAALCLVWGGSSRRAARAWLGAGLALALGWEIGQGLGWIPGTFDWGDLVGSAIGYAAGALLGMRRAARESA